MGYLAGLEAEWPDIQRQCGLLDPPGHSPARKPTPKPAPKPASRHVSFAEETKPNATTQVQRLRAALVCKDSELAAKYREVATKQVVIDHQIESLSRKDREIAELRQALAAEREAHARSRAKYEREKVSWHDQSQMRDAEMKRLKKELMGAFRKATAPEETVPRRRVSPGSVPGSVPGSSEDTVDTAFLMRFADETEPMTQVEKPPSIKPRCEAGVQAVPAVAVAIQATPVEEPREQFGSAGVGYDTLHAAAMSDYGFSDEEAPPNREETSTPAMTSTPCTSRVQGPILKGVSSADYDHATFDDTEELARMGGEFMDADESSHLHSGLMTPPSSRT
ncbi:hypothetical protein DICA2_C07228 [Diutina catenulata]